MQTNYKDIIKQETIETDDGFTNTKQKHLFTAIKRDDKIFVFFDENIGEEYEENRLFCDYLKNNNELDLFFESIEIEEYIITNDMCGGHYQYGENPKGQRIIVSLNVHETIDGCDREFYFCDGMWFTIMDNEELVGDVAETSRDKYIQSFREELTKRNNGDLSGYIVHQAVHGFKSKTTPRYSREDVISIYNFDPNEYRRFASPNKEGLYSLGALRNMVAYGKPIAPIKLEEIWKQSQKESES